MHDLTLKEESATGSLPAIAPLPGKTCVCYCGNSTLSRKVRSDAEIVFSATGMDYTAEAI